MRYPDNHRIPGVKNKHSDSDPKLSYLAEQLIGIQPSLDRKGYNTSWIRNFYVFCEKYNL